MIDQFVGTLFPHQENIVDIPDFPVPGIAENPSQMRQRLNAGNEFHAVHRRISVHLPPFRFGISAAQVTEIRFPVHLIGIFGVQADGIVSER